MTEDRRRGPCPEERKEKIRKATIGKKKTIISPNPSWFKKGEPRNNYFNIGRKPWNKDRLTSVSRVGKRYKKWRNSVLERDKYRCQKCGSEKKLHCHHIVPWKEDESLRFSPENGLTLCNACHSREEGVLLKVGVKSRFQEGHIVPKEWIDKANEKRIGKPAWNKGIPASPEMREKLRKYGIGKIPWNKGIKTGVKPPNLFCKGHEPWNKNIRQEIPLRKICTICKVEKEISYFTPMQKGKWYSGFCKMCRNAHLKIKRK